MLDQLSYPRIGQVTAISAWLFLFGLVAPIAPAPADGFSMLVKVNNGAFLIQIVLTPEGHLTKNRDRMAEL